MKLSELEPKLSANGVLRFTCPKPDCLHGRHAIRVPLIGSHWTHSGNFLDTLTVIPSIDAGCWHGFITDGKVL